MARIRLEFLSITLPVLLLAFLLAREFDLKNVGDEGKYIQTIEQQLDLPTTCQTSHLTAFETANPSILLSTSPLDPFDAPKFSALNRTAGEQWAFDGTSASGRSGLLLGIYRDASYAFLGPGNFRVSLDVVWDNGTTFSTVDYLARSVVHVCENQVVGIWASAIDEYYVFQATRDSKHARVHIHTKEVTGSFAIHSTTPSRYPNGALVSDKVASTWNAPMLHWGEPIPAGGIEVDLTIQGSAFRWTGLGGHDRWWSGKGWLEILTKWEAVRLTAGPYSLSFWQPTSRLNGVSYPSPFLTKHGVNVFSAQRNSVSETDNHILYRSAPAPRDGGSMHDPVGYEIELISPSVGKKWSFTLEYRNQEFAFDLGGGAGGSAYVGRVKGGEDGEEPYEGVFFIEHVDVESLTVPKLYVIVCEWYYQFRAKVLGRWDVSM
ncbi:hypothetical protein DTO006G1_2787 [Penicillium roqueforti]|uniref:uncharacterized protein n=1 Tax=Penicillium roqueforti TaxID=5082 RepID=UPI001909FCE6|nr:uncharacterized protein LCP9604111_2036 [Penicillium roqueforti]KAF9252040.1 hypothetical protein LCP9604111_2036 [Penicillium roqueforti]KAI1837309.1 hypothetical protein CBS147337_1592 [Penicillium roqueforti]KAI2687746.1 hypothetical protein LCP963914a_3264 [Penicillium roqueforti]KAI2689889.1 hypothetical protein CBS147355_340 [Penicillium roqueforti]KAI2702423.1 hypothetical protein CBS147372_4156 [Penicillium roqueforti]